MKRRDALKLLLAAPFGTLLPNPTPSPTPSAKWVVNTEWIDLTHHSTTKWLMLGNWNWEIWSDAQVEERLKGP